MRIRTQIDELFASDRDLGDVLEAEVTEFLGRERYVRGERVRVGSRNGHCPTTIKATAGPGTLGRPSCAAPTRPSRVGCSGSGSVAPTPSSPS